MRILRNYVIRESFFPFIMSLGALTCVFLLGNLIKLTDLVINKGVSLSTVGRIFLLYVPVLIGYTLPIACLISVILAMSRLSTDNEIIAIRASGIHILRLLFPFVVLGMILSLVSIILNNRIIPYAHYEQKKLVKNLGMENPTAMLEAGIFIDSFDDQILFIHRIDQNNLFNVTIYQPQENGPTRTIIAKRGEFTPVPGENQIKLKLIDGTSDEPLGDSNTFYKLNFENYFMTLDFSDKKKKINKKPKGMTFDELNAEIDRLQRLFVDTSRLRTEILRKITWSFSPLFFVMLGFPIAVITHRREKSANVVLAIFCALGYYLISMACEGLSAKAIVVPEVVMWIPNIIAGVIALILNYKCAS